MNDMEVRLQDLEWKLDRYHRKLEEALEHDREFQLKATWGIVSSICGTLAFLSLLWAGTKLGMTGWLLGTILGVVALSGFAIGTAYAERGRADDSKKLSRLPKWREE